LPRPSAIPRLARHRAFRLRGNPAVSK
jgi:hypothetical protein